MEKEEEYKGIWKNIGCTLSVIVIFSMIAVFVILIIALLSKA